MNASALYEKYLQKMQKINDVRMASAVLNWDQETYQPINAAAIRAQQLATLSGIAHILFTENELGEILNTLTHSKDLDAVQLKNVQLSLDDFNREKKYSTEFVELMSKTISESYHAWIEAREKNDFKIFAPTLKKLVELKKQEATLLGYQNHPYDALMHLYEPNQTVADTDILFEELKKDLVPFLQSIAHKTKPKNDFMYGHFPKKQQWDLGMDLLKQMRFDFNCGRQDESVHPFTTSFGSTDVRLTTHIKENDFYTMIWSCLHEGGHGLYEQGLPIEQYGLPGSEAVSLGIHESQSRLWENMVGRSKPYWQGNWKLVQQHFPEQFKNISADDFYKVINIVEPSFIRIEADELTYHFHIMIRYEIEKMLIGDEISVDDIPTIWNQKYYDYMGIKVPDDKQGCLQDIHWSHGSFGYFPTYSIGSFYAAQFFHYAQQQISGLDEMMMNGEFEPLLQWLRKNVHQYGRLKSAKEICENICGKPLDVKYFINYAKQKFETI